MVSYAMLHTFGFHAYNPLFTPATYSPGDPGLSSILDLSTELSFTVWSGMDAGKGKLEILGDASKVAVNELEMFIPLAQQYIAIYETQNDVRGVKLWRLVEKQLQDDFVLKNGVKFKKETRDSWEKLWHITTGGFEKSRKQGIVNPTVGKKTDFKF